MHLLALPGPVDQAAEFLSYSLTSVKHTAKLRDMAEQIITAAEAAKRLRISREAVYLAVRQKRLRSVEILGRIGIPLKALATYRPNQRKQRAGQSISLPRRKGARQS